MVTPGEKVNVTRCPTAGFAGAGVIERFESASVATAVNEVPDPEPPKLHAHEVGPPVELVRELDDITDVGLRRRPGEHRGGRRGELAVVDHGDAGRAADAATPATPLPVTVYVPGETYECVTVLQPPPIWQNEE